MSIYIIVENIPSRDEDGEYDVHECVCPALGYFTDGINADKLAERLCIQYCDTMRENGGVPTDDDETRFGVVLLDKQG